MPNQDQKQSTAALLVNVSSFVGSLTLQVDFDELKGCAYAIR
jgi:hypothetical protein